MKIHGISDWLIRYVIVFYVGAAVLMVGLKLYSRASFTPQKMEAMIDGRSKWEHVATSVCTNSIRGEPVDSGKEYIKVHFKCRTSETYNTLSLKAIPEKNWDGVITTLSSLNYFDKQELMSGEKWKCQLNGVDLKSETKFSNTDSVECYEK